MLSEYLTPTVKEWAHDRTQTVGASEIGMCARMVRYIKDGQPEDTPQGWGYAERGNAVEAWAMGRLRANGAPIEHVQQTFTAGFLSCTVDLEINGEPIDLKSFDPRKTRIPEPKNVMQSQVQSGLRGAARGHLFFINASDFEDQRPFVIEHDPGMFADLAERARWIMTTRDELPREGKWTGDCEYCPFQIACLGAPVEGKGTLSDDDRADLEAARDELRAAEADLTAVDTRRTKARERIRDILRRADVKRAPGLARISRSSRTVLDTEALERAGIDLAPYRKPGRVTESITVE